jgi:transglutaminase-like putative cysteine protease
MKLIPQSNNLNDYLKCSEVIDCTNFEIQKIAEDLIHGAENEIKIIKTVYEFVRDKIRHSSDVGEKTINWKASDTLKYKHGICFANSHLLAAILRALDIPTGFCYQRLEFDVGFGLHGLNAVYIKSLHKWIRLDARGNEGRIKAQFSIDNEILAYSVNEEKGEFDFPIVYAEPDKKVIEILKNSHNLDEAIQKVISINWLPELMHIYGL